MDKLGIFVFTNDNSILLNELIQSLTPLSNHINIHIIDDSFKTNEIELNKIIAKKISKNCYLGKEQFDNFYSRIISRKLDFKHTIGNKEWNLGTARNFGLDYARQESYDKVLFIDQDINSFCLDELIKGFQVVDHQTYVSFELEGLKDDSILGHIANKYGLEMEDERMLSGGFLYFTPVNLNHRFLNIYNEDWILQLQDNQKKRILLPYKAFHNGNLPSHICMDKLLFQELGEIVVTGLIIDSKGLLRRFSFWERIVKQRKVYIKKLLSHALKEKDYEIHKVLSLLIKNYDLIKNQLTSNILHFKKMKEKNIKFKSYDGYDLEGVFLKAKNEKAALLFVHGITSSMDELGFHSDYAKFLSENGVSTFRFNYRFHGGINDGNTELTELSLCGIINDIDLAFNTLKDSCDTTTQSYFIVGTSFGGGLSAYWADSVSEVKIKKIILNAPVINYQDDVLERNDLIQNGLLTKHAQEQLKKEGFVNSSGIHFGRGLINEVKYINGIKAIQNLAEKVIVFHGDDDQDVPLSSSQKYKHTKTQLEIIPKVGHGFGVEDDEDLDSFQTKEIHKVIYEKALAIIQETL